MKISEAHTNWTDLHRPAVVEQFGEDDEVALSEAWSEYTDSLCKEGELTDLQYHYCPAHDDPMPEEDEEAEWLLKQMGVTFRRTLLTERTDNLMSGMPEGSHHFFCSISRKGDTLTTEFSQGPAVAERPTLGDVFYALLQDVTGVDQPFEDWAADLGFDEDSRAAEKIFKVCRQMQEQMALMFTGRELDDLAEAFEDY